MLIENKEHQIFSDTDFFYKSLSSYNLPTYKISFDQELFRNCFSIEDICYIRLNRSDQSQSLSSYDLLTNQVAF